MHTRSHAHLRPPRSPNPRVHVHPNSNAHPSGLGRVCCLRHVPAFCPLDGLMGRQGELVTPAGLPGQPGFCSAQPAPACPPPETRRWGTQKTQSHSQVGFCLLHGAHESLDEHRANYCKAQALLSSNLLQIDGSVLFDSELQSSASWSPACQVASCPRFQSELENAHITASARCARANWGGPRGRGSSSQEAAPRTSLPTPTPSSTGSVRAKDDYLPQRILEYAAKSRWTPWEAFWDGGGPPHRQVALSGLLDEPLETSGLSHIQGRPCT